MSNRGKLGEEVLLSYSKVSLQKTRKDELWSKADWISVIKKLEKKQVSGLCSRGKENKKLVLLVLFPLGQRCYKSGLQVISQVMVAHVFRNSSPRQVKVSETRRWSTWDKSREHGFWFWLKFRKDEDASVYETITGHNIQRMVEALSVWWYMNCFEEAMTPGGFSGISDWD